MTPKPPPPPRPPSRFSQRDLAAQYVGEILKQKAEEAAKVRAAPRRQRAAGRSLTVLVPVLLGLTGWNVGRMVREPAVFTSGETEAALRFRIYLAAEAVRTFKDSAGTLPADIKDIGLDRDEGLVYAPLDTTYIITGVADEVRLTYRGDQDLGPFAAAYDVLVGGRPRRTPR